MLQMRSDRIAKVVDLRHIMQQWYIVDNNNLTVVVVVGASCAARMRVGSILLIIDITLNLECIESGVRVTQ
jgi:hypothetical protein